MLLKRLSLVGFKSFADRTHLEFDAGVNVVVGPNGTGKSNILDALAWVMGTQATTVLRTERMDDVIFAGTATRPSMGRAEVTVTFDNRDRFLPLDLDEVAMTRRLYRDGTSDYELNGTPCRLLDLQELLRDGGVGRHQHVLVSQGEIGDILSARPDEHRAVIEEAAGITKHRGRRDRSVRRLERTDQDIERLTDIFEQQRRRLRPLKRQANAAERYDTVKAEVRALHLWIGGSALLGIRTRLETASEEEARLVAVISADSAELEETRAALGSLRAGADEVGAALQRDSAAAARLETVGERFHRIATVARERRQFVDSRRQRRDDRVHDLQTERAELDTQIAADIVEEGDARRLADRREAALQALEDEERSLAEQTQLPAAGMAAALRGDLRSLEAAEERDRRESEALALRREFVEARLTDQTGEVVGLGQAVRDSDAAAAAAQDEYRTARAAREAAQVPWDEAEERQRLATVDLARAQARVETIEAGRDGLDDPAGRLLVEGAAGVIGSIVAHLDVPADVAPAVDAALGVWRNALVAEGPERLEALVAEVKAGGFGGVALVAAGRAGELVAARPVAEGMGLDALVDRLGPRAEPGLAQRFLGDVVLVESWLVGWDLVQRHPGLCAVTPEGDLIGAQGVYLTEPDGAGPAALEAAHVALERAQTAEARARSASVTTRRTFDDARTAERAALEQLEDLEAKLAGHTEALALVEQVRSESAAESARLEARHDALMENGAARKERMVELRRAVDEFQGDERARQLAWDALNRRREAVAKRRDEARRLREDAMAALAGVVERRKLLATRLGRTAQEIAEVGDVIIEPERPEVLQTTETRARRGREIVRRHVETLRERQRALREEMGAADERVTHAHERQRHLETQLGEAKEQATGLAVELAELRVREEAACEALRRDADATEDEALEATEPGSPDGDHLHALQSAEARLRRMGPINPLAAPEYQELAAELELLEAQLGDLGGSRRELRKVIAALDDEMAAMFRQAFDDIAALFEENFRIVFPGGSGRLILTDPDHPLDTGVDIEAQPMGKKVGRLSLLSGGERSLAALAFLFAVFRARPSPFYVLDEVEAALDDSNLRRFLGLVDTLRRSAQLVIITHQQQTMGAADILYGVTMEPGESSIVVAKRLAEAAV